MSKRSFTWWVIMFALTAPYIYAQEYTQVVRGTVVDAETRAPLSFATVSVQTTKNPMGATTDLEGNFRLEKVPVGRHDIHVSYLGYEGRVVPELMIGTGKETVLIIGLKEKITEVEEVVVKAYTKKDKPLNTMSTLSARTFSVEEAQRYAGGMDDPARLASAFAGVSTGYLEDNGIIVRGNAPKGLLWRLEGVEIPNPNHFAGMTTFGGGGVSALSSLMLANSDFFTGAFPAEYGNAMSGVFDLKLRKGNNQHHEHAVQLGAMGLDISSEGPFSKNHQASYLFNYRYSTFGLIQPVLPEEANIPNYQDLSFKINMPTSRAGIFSLWGLGADNKIKFEADMDTSLWRYAEDREVGNATQQSGATGLNHRYLFGGNTYLNTSLAMTGDYTHFKEDVMDFDLQRHQTDYIDNLNYKFTFTSALNHKFSARHTNRTGFIVNNYHYENVLKFAPVPGDSLLTATDEEGASNLYQWFSQSKINLSQKVKMNLGIHGQYFDLNKEFILEPRLGVSYSFKGNQSLSLAYGKHSRLEPLSIYFARVPNAITTGQPNKKLGVTKAHHMVLAYDLSLSKYLRLKVEPYFQYLYDVPVIPDSSYSTVNMEAEWFFTNKLENNGTGTNMGIDLTLERFLNKGYYYLFTASLFESKYTGGDEIERSTRFNTRFVFNLLFGKEWVLGNGKNKILGINGRLNVLGGQRITPLNRELSLEKKEIRYDYSRQFEARKPMVYHFNASINFRVNKNMHSSIWSFQVLNAFGSEEFFGYDYNFRTGMIDRDAVTVIVPNISYKIEF